MATNYSYGELINMQEDAMRRVREMQKLSTQATQTANNTLFNLQSAQSVQQNTDTTQYDSTPEKKQNRTIPQPSANTAQDGNTKSPSMHPQQSQNFRTNNQNNYKRSPFWMRPQVRKTSGNPRPVAKPPPHSQSDISQQHNQPTASQQQNNQPTASQQHNQSAASQQQHNQSTASQQHNQSAASQQHNQSTASQQHNQSTASQQHNQSTASQQ
ncbi:MAG: hypothetical protein RR914_03505, partial [Oscillospiraceae bacterium]